jgi:UDP-2,3-diacylglucosamine pyrophosphatase LpxH
MTTRPFRILYLSDIHFGTKFFLHDKKAGQNPMEWAMKFANDLERGLENNGIREILLGTQGSRHFDLLVVSGDLTCHSQPEGMQAAEYFFAEVQGSANRAGRWWSADDVLLIPGNHDIVFGAKPAKDDDSPILRVSLPREQREALYRETYLKITGNSLRGKWLGHLKAYPEHRLAIIALDSCRLESWVAPGLGFVGLDQVKVLGDQALSTQLRETDESDAGPWHRITFLHHHITGMGEASGAAARDFLRHRHFTLTWDAEDIIEGLQKYCVDFIFHGHYHRPELRLGYNRVQGYGRVFSAGSAGVEGELCSDLHQFFVLEIKDAEAIDLRNGEQRFLDVKSFQRELRDGVPGEWTIEHHETFNFSEKPEVEMSPQTVAELNAKAHSAQSTYHSYESWPLAVLFLMEQDTREWTAHLKDVSGRFEVIWNVRRQQDSTLPAFEKAIALLIGRLRLNGADLLREFAEDLDGDSPQTFEAFLVEKMYNDPELRKQR